MIPLIIFFQTGEPADEIHLINSQAYAYFKLIFVLAAILIFAYVTLRYWMPKLSNLGQKAAGPLQIVGRLSLEPRKNLYVVRTGQELFLIGTSEADLHYLTPLNAAPAEFLVASRIDSTAKNI